VPVRWRVPAAEPLPQKTTIAFNKTMGMFPCLEILDRMESPRKLGISLSKVDVDTLNNSPVIRFTRVAKIPRIFRKQKVRKATATESVHEVHCTHASRH
jgi:hypothetical protein